MSDDLVTPREQRIGLVILLLLVVYILAVRWLVDEDEPSSADVEPVPEMATPELQVAPIYADSIKACDTTGLSDEVICYHLGER